MTATARNEFTGVAKAATGIFYTGSLIKIADITDGTSQHLPHRRKVPRPRQLYDRYVAR